jgi:molybdopterin synthase catalytic subunit
MYTLSVVGTGADDLLARLVPRLEGRVATVGRTEEATERPGPAAVEGAADGFALDGEGGWVGGGGDRRLDGLLEDLAAEYDYALLSGFPSARVPTVVLGEEGNVAGEVLARAADADGVNVEELLAALHDREPHVTLSTLVERAKASPRADRAGAIATFTGRVRGKDSPDDAHTERLAFEKYEGVAEERMRAIEDELTERDGVFEVHMFHRTGVIEDGEDIVFVVVLAGHRTEAFRTVEDGINRLKDEVPIFKKETTTDEEFWVHEQS